MLREQCANSKHDDHDGDKMNTLTFFNVLLIKFSQPKFCAISLKTENGINQYHFQLHIS